MNSDGIRGFALKMLDSRLTEAQKQDPQIQELVRMIRENDEAAGVKFANNYCKSRNLTPQDAIGNAIRDMGLG